MKLRTLLLLTVTGSVFCQQALAQGVTFDRILHAGIEPQNWLTYSGSPSSQR